MENFFDTVFYNLYLLYTKVIPDWDPLFTVYSIIGFLFSIPFAVAFHIIVLLYFNIRVGGGILFLISMIFVYFSYLYFAKSRRYSKIIRSKPYVVNRTFSKIATFLYIIINLSFVYLGLGTIGHNIKDDKREKGEVVKILDISLKRGLVFEEYKTLDEKVDEALRQGANNK